MRYRLFLSLAGIALVLDLVLLGIGIATQEPYPSLGEPVLVRAASDDRIYSSAQAHLPQPSQTPSPTATATDTPPTKQPTAPPTQTPLPTATTTPLPPTPTTTPLPEPRLLASHTVSFTPHNRAVAANIQLALNYAYDSLSHVVLPPGKVFSFNETLGADPEGLPWKTILVPQPTSGEVPADQPTPEPIREPVRGGGLCDLASRYVMAARPLLPSRAFRFVNHVRSNGIRLHGVPTRDSVSIWAVGGGRNEHDLLIRNTTAHWLEFLVEREGKRIVIHARLWDRAPPNW